MVKKFFIFFAVLAADVFAQTTTTTTTNTSTNLTIGDIGNNLIGLLSPSGTLIMGGAYIAGIVMFISAVFKFKQYKDNSTQIPIGTTFALFGLSIVLIFLPGLYMMTGYTLFGADPDSFGYSGSNIFGFPE